VLSLGLSCYSLPGNYTLIHSFLLERKEAEEELRNLVMWKPPEQDFSQEYIMKMSGKFIKQEG
jgi:hypothetical protein